VVIQVQSEFAYKAQTRLSPSRDHVIWMIINDFLNFTLHVQHLQSSSSGGAMRHKILILLLSIAISIMVFECMGCKESQATKTAHKKHTGKCKLFRQKAAKKRTKFTEVPTEKTPTPVPSDSETVLAITEELPREEATQVSTSKVSISNVDLSVQATCDCNCSGIQAVWPSTTNKKVKKMHDQTTTTEGGSSTAATGRGKPTRLVKKFNLESYKPHALGDYAMMIRLYGPTDGYSSQTVSTMNRYFIHD